MKRLVFLVFMLLWNVGIGFCQHPLTDSLLVQLKKAKSDTARLLLLSDLAFYNASGNTAIARKHAGQQLELAQKVAIPKFTANAYNDLGTVEFYAGNFEKALASNQKALAIRQKIGDPALLISSLNKIAAIYNETGRYKKAAGYEFRILELCEKTGNEAYAGMTLGNIAALFGRLRNYKENEKYARAALKIAQKTNNKSLVAGCYANLAVSFENTGRPDSAVVSLELAANIYRELNDSYRLTTIYDNLGIINRNQNKFKKALEYHIKAYNLALQNGYAAEAASYAINIAQQLLDLRRVPEAKTYLKNALLIAESRNNKVLLKDTYRVLNEYYTLTKQPDSAIAYVKKYQTISDSLYSEGSSRQIARLQMQYETAKKEQQIATLNQQNLKQQLSITRRNTIIGVIAGLFLIACMVAYLVYSRYKLKQEARLQHEIMHQQDLATKAILEAEENERSRIAGDLHDGLGQLFSAVKMNLSGLESQVAFTEPAAKTNYEKTVALVDESCKEVRSISHQMAPNVLLKAGLVSAVRDFVTKIDASRLKIYLDVEGLQERLDTNVETVLYRVIQESVNNVIKHAGATQLDIQLIRDGSGLSAMIEDNGKGFSLSEKQVSEGMGLKNITSRVAYLKGTVDFDSAPGKGTVISIWVPLSEPGA